MSVWVGISSPSELQNIKNDTAAKYKITRDIDMEGFLFATIENEFSGILDGQGYRIKNLVIDNGVANTSEETGGLFKEISGTIKNIKLEDIEIKGKHLVAPLGTQLLNSGIIENVFVSNLNIEAGKSYGGIVGLIKDQSKIERCQVITAIELKGGNHSCGGITSAMEGDSRIRDCCFEGEMTSGNRGLIVGRVSGNNQIERCLGILSTGSASGLWYTSDQSEEDDSFYDSTLLLGDKNGIGKSTEELQTPETYLNAGWDIETWRIVPGSYAQLPLKIQTRNMLGYLYGTPYSEKVIVKEKEEAFSGTITGLKYDTDINSMNKLAIWEWEKSNGGEVISTNEITYNSKGQAKKVTEYSYEYNGIEGLVPKFNIEETDYYWESATDNDDVFNKNLMDLLEKTTYKTALGTPGNVKVTSGEKFEYDTSFNKLETWVLDSQVQDDWRKTEEIIERDFRNNMPIKTKIYGLTEDTVDKEYLAETLFTSEEDPQSPRNSDVAVVEITGTGSDFYYLPTAEYEMHHLGTSGWTTTGDFVSLKNSKFKNRVITASEEYTVSFQELVNLDLQKEYLLCGWANTKGGTIKLNDDVIVNAGDEWIYFEELIVDRDSLELTCDPRSMIDYIWINSLSGDYSLNAYSNDLTRLNATIGKNGVVTHYIYNDQGIISDSVICNREGEIINYSVSTSGYSRFNGYNRLREEEWESEYDMDNPNTTLNIGFLGNGNYYEEFPKEVEVSRANFVIKLKNNEVDTDYGLTLKDSQGQIEAVFLFEKTQDYPTRKGVYKLILKDGREFSSDEEYEVNDWILVVQPGIFMFIGDGKLILSVKISEILSEGGLKVAPINTYKFEKIFISEDPVTNMSYIDSLGRERQNQYITLNNLTGLMDEVVVVENIYNGYGELSITTKSAPATDNELYRYRDDFVEGFGDSNQILGGQLVDSLMEMGASKADASYSYMESKTKPLTGRVEESTIGFGEVFATREEFKVQNNYDFEAEVSLEKAPKIGKTDYIPYKGKTKSQKHDTALSEFYTPDGEMIIGKVRNNMPSGAEFYSMIIELKEGDGERFVVSNKEASSTKLGYSETKDCDWILIEVGNNKFKIRAASGPNNGKYIKLEDDHTFSVDVLFEEATIFEKGDEGTSIKFKVSSSGEYWLDGGTLVGEDEREGLIVANAVASNFSFEESIAVEIHSNWNSETREVKTISPNSLEEIYTDYDPGYGRILKINEPDIDQEIYIVKNNYGQLRFIKDYADGAKWKYYSYDDLGRMVEMGVLKDGELDNIEGDISGTLEKANNKSYPSTSEGDDLVKYIYDIDEVEAGIDGSIYYKDGGKE